MDCSKNDLPVYSSCYFCWSRLFSPAARRNQLKRPQAVRRRKTRKRFRPNPEKKMNPEANYRTKSRKLQKLNRITNRTGSLQHSTVTQKPKWALTGTPPTGLMMQRFGSARKKI